MNDGVEGGGKEQPVGGKGGGGGGVGGGRITQQSFLPPEAESIVSEVCTKKPCCRDVRHRRGVRLREGDRRPRRHPIHRGQGLAATDRRSFNLEFQTP